MTVDYHASAPPSGYPPLHTLTPLVLSETLSANCGHNVFLKLETEQLSGSFKPRGIGRSCWAAVQRKGPNVHLVVASGGNAGLAAALSAQTLGVKCTVFVHNKTESLIKDRLLSYGAEVVVADGGWEKVDAGARALAASSELHHYVHPFEGDDLVSGHSSIIDEIYEQLPIVSSDHGIDAVTRPDMVCSAVGGGGMIRGIMLGLERHARRQKTPPVHVVGITTLGGDSWGLSVEQEDGLVELDNTFSQARSLVCKACAETSVQDARAYGSTGSPSSTPPFAHHDKHLTSVRIDDAYAGAAAWRATHESNKLIELSCGAALAITEHKDVLDHIAEKKNLPKRMNVVIVVCGGSRVTLADVEHFKEEYGDGYGDILVDGVRVKHVAAQ